MKNTKKLNVVFVTLLFFTAVFDVRTFNALATGLVSETYQQRHDPQDRAVSGAERAIEKVELLTRVSGGTPVFEEDDEEDALGAMTIAEEAIAIANDTIAIANDTIIKAKSYGFNVTQADRFLFRAVEALNSSKSAFENGEYHEAIRLANGAQSFAEKAEASAKKALEGIEEFEEDQKVALDAIAFAGEAIERANQTIVNAQLLGVNVTSAVLILNQSVEILSAAVEALSDYNFELALDLAEESRRLAEDANGVAESAIVQFEEQSRAERMEKAQVAIGNAEESVLGANETIARLRASGVDVAVAESLLTQANNTLHDAIVAFSDGYYEIATSLAEEAKALAELAVEFAESAQSELSFEALQIIVETEVFVQEIAEDLVSAQSVGADLTEAIGLLDSSFSRLAEAWEAFNAGNYIGAKTFAEEAKRLAENAQLSIEEAIQAFESESRRIVQEIIEEAEAALSQFEDKLEESSSKGLNVTACIPVFEVANITLQLAKQALYSGLFYEAKVLAEGVFDLVENGMELLASLSTSPVSELEASEDEAGNILVYSSVGNLSMSATKPSVAFYYLMNETSLDFGLDFLSFAEFVDINHDNVVQENEILQILRFDDSVWTKTLRVFAIDDNQVTSVVYKADSPYYDVTLEIRFFKYPTVFSASVDNATVVFDVSGAAMGAKINIEVDEWSWMSSKSELSLNTAIDVSTLGTVSENSTFHGNLAQILINMSNAVIVTGWLTKAKVVDPKGAESFIEVDVGYTTEQNEGGMKLSVSFIYPNFEGFALEHDPTIDVKLTPSLVIYVPFFSTVWLSIGSAVMISLIVFGVLLSARRGEVVKRVFERRLQGRRLRDVRRRQL